MIIDIDVRMLDGEMCLCKYGPTSLSPEMENCIENGYVNISIKNYAWQKIISIEKLRDLLNMENEQKKGNFYGESKK